MFLTRCLNFLRSKRPKTKRCKTLILNMSTTPSQSLWDMYGVKSGAKIQRSKEKNKGKVLFYFFSFWRTRLFFVFLRRICRRGFALAGNILFSLKGPKKRSFLSVARKKRHQRKSAKRCWARRPDVIFSKIRKPLVTQTIFVIRSSFPLRANETHIFLKIVHPMNTSSCANVSIKVFIFIWLRVVAAAYTNTIENTEGERHAARGRVATDERKNSNRGTAPCLKT